MNKPIKHDTNRVAIIGCGRVGMTTAYTLLVQDVADELILLSRSKEKAIGEQLDLEHSIPFLGSTKIISTENYEDLKDVDVVIFTAGISQTSNDTRLDLAKDNIALIEKIIPKIVKHAPNAIILIVSNPVDILTYKAYTLAGLAKGRIFGTGTTLDTLRFRFHLSEFLKVSPKSIHAYILGEHGDSSFPALSGAMIGGQNLLSFPNFNLEKAMAAYEKTKNAAYKIIASKGSTYYAIATATSHIVNAILKDDKEIMPVSVPLHNYHGHSGIALSLPCVIGRDGVEQIINVKLSWDERQKLDKSVNVLKEYL